MPVSFVRRHSFKALVAATVLILVVVTAVLVPGNVAQTARLPLLPTTGNVARLDTTKVDLMAGASEARYRAQEVLSGRGFNEAVGRTSGVQGSIVLDADGMVVPTESKISVDLTQLRSDSNLRDNFI